MQILHRGIFMPAFDRILQLARMEEMDCEFVEVTAHEGARPTHAVWQGRVYHRGGAVVQDGERYEDFEVATGYGTGPGLCGWNCRHNFYPFYPGVSVRNYTDERLAELDARSGACRTGRLRRGGPHGERHQEPKPGRVSRLVKRAGADTTLKNAVRDGAEWAWVPHGDTCPFCITLASNGWQKASSKVLKGGHADHIHANCDCEFAVRFDGSTTVAGYDPEKYLRQYRAAGSDVNAMRRIDYAARKDAINAQKRAAYAARKASTIEDEAAKIKAIKDTMTKQVLALPESAQEVLKAYTGFTATRVNFAIRHGSISPQIQETIAALDNALASGTMPQSVTLYRNTALSFLGFDIPDNPTEQELQELVGFAHEFPIFTSTSFRDLHLERRDTVIQIHVPKGYTGCQYLQPVAFPKFKNQDEILFARGMQYRILNACIENERYFLEIEVIPNV